MPKSTKKKKDKAADFSKAKLKLGKGKQLPTNVIDTSFKSRSIALPSQSIAHDKDGSAPTTKRRLTFDDLIAHMKHYNPSTRKDALFGLRELLEENPMLILPHLTALVNSCVRLIGDEDASVRKALLSFLSWLLPRVSLDHLQPHAPVLLLFTTSAQTHIFPEIRIDAIRFLDVFLEYIPEIVVEGWSQGGAGHGRRVLEGYLGVLNAGTAFGEGGDTGPVQATSTASVVLSPASKLVVLRSLSTFLNRAMSSRSRTTSIAPGNDTASSSSSTPTWFLASSFASLPAFNTFDSLIRPSHHPIGHYERSSSSILRTWSENIDVDEDTIQEDFVGSFHCASTQISDSFTLQDLASIDFSEAGTTVSGGQSGTGSNAEYAYVLNLSIALHSTLVSTFLDCAPTVFSPGGNPPETDLSMILAVSEITRTLYGSLLQHSDKNGKSGNASSDDLNDILGYMSPYFPFTVGGSSTVKRDIKTEQTFQDLNLIFCELTSLLVLASPSEYHSNPRARHGRTTSKRARVPSGNPGKTALLRVDRVKAYVIQLLRGELPSGSSSQTALPRPITSTAYNALLPTIWALLNSAPLEQGHSDDTLLVSLVEHAMKVSSNSLVKRHTIDFLGRLVLLETVAEYQGTVRIGKQPEADKKLEEWLLHLPKTLWELGASNMSTTETILRLLLRLSQRRSSLLCNKTSTSMRARLVPYFAITHATRGKLPGPFTKLTPGSPLRSLALDVAATLCLTDGDDNSTQALGAAVHEVVANTTDEKAYWISISSSITHR